jgi:hypothetical protein
MLTKKLGYTFIKIKIKNAGVLPSWHLSHGNNSWLFVDELIIQ